MDPKPDPDNSPPEDWTEPLSDEEQQEIADRLRRELDSKISTMTSKKWKMLPW